MVNEQVIIKKGMDCLYKNLGTIEIEMFISAIMKSAYDYTQWRVEYFENAYSSGDKSQLENFLVSAANNDPKSISFGIQDRKI